MLWLALGFVFAICAGVDAQAALYGRIIFDVLAVVGFFLYAAADKIASALKGQSDIEKSDVMYNDEIGEVDDGL